MTTDMIEKICRERIGGWVEKLVREHSTPLLLVGVGHDAKRGQITLCTLDEPIADKQSLVATLRFAIKQLETSQ